MCYAAASIAKSPARTPTLRPYVFEKQRLIERLCGQSAGNKAIWLGHVRAVGRSRKARGKVGMPAKRAARGLLPDLRADFRPIDQHPGGGVGHQGRQHCMIEL